MKEGFTPTEACELALEPIQKYYPGTKGPFSLFSIFSRIKKKKKEPWFA
jgi:hypothetical protein